MAIILALVAVALGLVGEARPIFLGDDRPGGRVRVVVDRGIGMAARTVAQKRALFGDLQRELHRRFGNLWVRLEAIPPISEQEIELTSLAESGTALAVTAVETGDAVRAAVNTQRSGESGPVIVITDHAAGTSDGRTLIGTPEGPVSNVGLAHVAVGEELNPQVMVRLRNDSAATSARLRVLSDGEE